MNWQLRLAQAYRSTFLVPREAPPTQRQRLWNWVTGKGFGRINPSGERVLKDLAHFCRSNQPSVMWDDHGRIDPLAMARMDGRREVWQRMLQFLYIDEKVLTNLPNEDSDHD